MARRLPLGAPGIYDGTPEAPLRALTGVRMDVCAFIGVAPKGPVRVPVLDEVWTLDTPALGAERPRRHAVPVAIQSWDEYRRLFGAFEGPGLLPYAVSTFFEQGGQKAYVVRVVHAYGDADDDGAVASGVVPGVTVGGGAVKLLARNEGAWGNDLRATFSFVVEPVMLDDTPTTTGLVVPPDTWLPIGSFLRLTLAGGVREYQFVADSRLAGKTGDPKQERVITLAGATTSAAVSVDVVRATLRLADGDGNEETHDGVGLSPLHPRWLGKVLFTDSVLCFADPAWDDGTSSLLPNPKLLTFEANPSLPQFSGGEDRYQDIIPDDFFDPAWVLGDEEPGDRGVHAVVYLSDLSLVVAPDLYSPEPLVPQEPVLSPLTLSGATFTTCVVAPPVEEQAEPTPGLDGLRLNPEDPTDLAEILELQGRLVELADTLRSFIVLLDAPPKLHQRQLLAWRARLRSPFAAAYHPWLGVARPDDGRDTLIWIPPSSVAAGIVALQERLFGVQNGPANAIATEVVMVRDEVSPARHDQLHQNAINVFLRESDGVRLTGARTLSSDRDYRQLNVRRLVTLIERTLDQQCQWMVFEPNSAALRGEFRRIVRGLLRQLFQANAFRGATEDESFFVRCDEGLNPTSVTDLGRLVAEVGVAPAEPLEFIVLRIVRDGDSTLRVEG